MEDNPLQCPATALDTSEESVTNISKLRTTGRKSMQNNKSTIAGRLFNVLEFIYQSLLALGGLFFTYAIFLPSNPSFLKEILTSVTKLQWTPYAYWQTSTFRSAYDLEQALHRQLKTFLANGQREIYNIKAQEFEKIIKRMDF